MQSDIEMRKIKIAAKRTKLEIEQQREIKKMFTPRINTDKRSKSLPKKAQKRDNVYERFSNDLVKRKKSLDQKIEEKEIRERESMASAKKEASRSKSRGGE
jgi:hypothetical protein